MSSDSDEIIFISDTFPKTSDDVIVLSSSSGEFISDNEEDKKNTLFHGKNQNLPKKLKRPNKRLISTKTTLKSPKMTKIHLQNKKNTHKNALKNSPRLIQTKSPNKSHQKSPLNNDTASSSEHYSGTDYSESTETHETHPFLNNSDTSDESAASEEKLSSTEKEETGEKCDECGLEGDEDHEERHLFSCAACPLVLHAMCLGKEKTKEMATLNGAKNGGEEWECGECRAKAEMTEAVRKCRDSELAAMNFKDALLEEIDNHFVFWVFGRLCLIIMDFVCFLYFWFGYFAFFIFFVVIINLIFLCQIASFPRPSERIKKEALKERNLFLERRRVAKNSKD